MSTYMGTANAIFTYGLVWDAAQRPLRLDGPPSSKKINYIDMGVQTYVMKGPPIILAQGLLKA